MRGTFEVVELSRSHRPEECPRHHACEYEREQHEQIDYFHGGEPSSINREANQFPLSPRGRGERGMLKWTVSVQGRCTESWRHWPRYRAAARCRRPAASLSTS